MGQTVQVLFHRRASKALSCPKGEKMVAGIRGRNSAVLSGGLGPMAVRFSARGNVEMYHGRAWNCPVLDLLCV
jgi:hypothetical protein